MADFHNRTRREWMATVDLGRSNSYTDGADAQAIPLRRPLLQVIRWSAIIAGVAVGLSVQLLLTLLGVAIGLSSIDVANPGTDTTGAMLWASLGMLVSSFAGGYVAARMSGLRRRIDGVLHGAVSWAVSTLIFAVLATSFSSSLLRGIFNNMGNGPVRSALSYGNNETSPLDALLRRHMGNDMDVAILRRLHQQIEAGQRDEAIREINSIGVDRMLATAIVDKALLLSQSLEPAAPQQNASENQAIGAANTATWLIFFAVTFSLAVGIGGGVLGAIGARRVAWASTEIPGDPV
jgi:hypothetical protein